MGEDIFLDKWTMYIDGHPFNASIDKGQLEVLENSQSNNIENIMELLKKPICIELTGDSIKSKNLIKELTYKAKIKNLINIYNKTKKFRIKKKLAKRINELLTKK